MSQLKKLSYEAKYCDFKFSRFCCHYYIIKSALDNLQLITFLKVIKYFLLHQFHSSYYLYGNINIKINYKIYNKNYSELQLDLVTWNYIYIMSVSKNNNPTFFLSLFLYNVDGVLNPLLLKLLKSS